MIKKIVWISLVLLYMISPSVFAQNCDETKTIVQGNYATESLDDERLQNWYVSRPNIPQDSIALAPAPYNSSITTVKFTSRKGDSWNNLGYPRSELDMGGYFTFELGKTYTISTSFYFDPISAFGTKELLALFQVHHEGNGSPPVAIFLENGNLYFSHRPGPFERNTMSNYGATPLGRRVGLKIIYKPDTTQTGVIQYYFDGSLVNEFVGQTMYPGSPNGGYLKQGIYDYDNSITDKAILYMEPTTVTETTSKTCAVIIPASEPSPILSHSSSLQQTTVTVLPTNTITASSASQPIDTSSSSSVSLITSSVVSVESNSNQSAGEVLSVSSSASSLVTNSESSANTSNLTTKYILVVVGATVFGLGGVVMWKARVKNKVFK
jgi:hypothetical protein